jgi:hypothetical protein
MPNPSAIDSTPQQDQAHRIGLCKDCNYSLIGLPSNRCPECGREFDPDDPNTMNMGQPMGPIARLLISPVGWPTFAVMTFGMMAVLWGLGWLPGGMAVFAAGIGLVILAYCYRLVRALLRWIAIAVYCQPRDGALASRQSAPLIILLVSGVLIATEAPLWTAITISRWMCEDELRRIYEVDPAPASPNGSIGQRWVGLFYARDVRVLPSGIRIDVAWAGHITIDGNHQIWSTRIGDLRRSWN